MQKGFESTPTVKDAHSPAGQPFHAPKSFADMPDCPICRYGTPVECKDYWLCIDCGAKMSKDQVIRNNSPI
jgi:rubredoxin